MASKNFTNLPRALAKGEVNFSSMSCKVLLLTSVPTEGNLDGWVNRSDLSGEVANGNGYATGGIAQSFTLDALDTTNNKQTVTYANISNGWTSATISAAAAVIYKDSGNASTDTLLHVVDFGGTVTCTNGNFSITYTTPFEIAA